MIGDKEELGDDDPFAQQAVAQPHRIAHVVCATRQKVVEPQRQVVLKAEQDAIRYSAQYEVEADRDDRHVVRQLIQADLFHVLVHQMMTAAAATAAANAHTCDHLGVCQVCVSFFFVVVPVVSAAASWPFAWPSAAALCQQMWWRACCQRGLFVNSRRRRRRRQQMALAATHHHTRLADQTTAMRLLLRLCMCMCLCLCHRNVVLVVVVRLQVGAVVLGAVLMLLLMMMLTADDRRGCDGHAAAVATAVAARSIRLEYLVDDVEVE